MLTDVLLIVHIVVVGYWLGADLCINSTFRYVSRRASLPFSERAALLDHVLEIDQHVRYALVLQVAIGTALAAWFGYVPGGESLAVVALMVGIGWLGFVEVVHRHRHAPAGAGLARLDRGSRYVLVAALLIAAGGGLLGVWLLPWWLAIKLALLAAAVCCGVGIRLQLIRYFSVWRDIEREGSNDELEHRLWQRYRSATAVLILLWICIAAIVAVSIAKPI